MAELKKPSMLSPIIITLAALLDLLAAFMMAASNTNPKLLRNFVLCVIILIACAIAVWIKYFKAYVNFVIGQKLSQNNKKVED